MLIKNCVNRMKIGKTNVVCFSVAEDVNMLSKLNVVLCGSDSTLKSSISNLILNQRDNRSELRECVKLEGEVDGRLITLVELPALTQLSEKEVMRQTLRCVSLCDPGVHVFLFIVSDGPLTDEDKTETEEIQKIFSSKINNHIMVLIIQESEHKTEELNEKMKFVIECFGGRYHIISPNLQVSMLMTKLEQMVEENRSCYSTETFLDAQIEKIEEMRKKVNSLEKQIQQQGNDQKICMSHTHFKLKNVDRGVVMGTFVTGTEEHNLSQTIAQTISKSPGEAMACSDINMTFSSFLE